MEFIIKDNALTKIIHPEVEIHIPEGVIKLASDVFNSNEITKDVYFPASLTDCNQYRSLIFRYQENIFVNENNPVFSSYDGVLYNKDLTTLICCPMRKKGVLKVAPTTKEIAQDAFCCSELDELILNEGLESIHRWAFADASILKPILIPHTVSHISDKAFEGEWSGGSVVVYPESYGHRYAKMIDYVRFSCVPYNNIPLWDDAEWITSFAQAKEQRNYNQLHSLRKQVFLSTIEIIKYGKYQISDGQIISLNLDKNIASKTKFYSEEIPAAKYPKRYHTQIAAVQDDCLAFARKVCAIEDDVCVLNMASRRNPGGGVLKGAGAQEEYLFRCSDYYKSLYQFTDYASQYDIVRAACSYPLDRNYGGIFTPNVTIIRDTEESGYRLLHCPWKVNMVAVAGMNRPALEVVDGEERILPSLVEFIKNKMRTVLRICATNNQKTLILGALGCGAFRNPPKHTAELFKQVLAESEFSNVFRRVLFVIKEDHNSGGTNFAPFAEVFGEIESYSQLKAEGLLRCKDELKNDSIVMFHTHCTPDEITRLRKDEVFVFGTNPEGKHNSRAALFAVENFGAKMGVGEGFSENSYAIPVHKHRIEKMRDAVHRFIEFAKREQNKMFYVLPIGCGKAGLDALTVAPMFKDAIGLKNIALPQAFITILQDNIWQKLSQFDLHTGKLLHTEHFGNRLQWSLYGDGTLEISGYGAMPNYLNHWDSYFGEGQPKWIGCEKYGVMPCRLIIRDGITYVGANSFESFGCLKEVFLANSVVNLGKMAFFDCFNIKRINVPSNMSIRDFDKAELPLYYNKSFIRVGDWLVDTEITNGKI